MKKNVIYLFAFVSLLFIAACSDDDTTKTATNAAAFANPAINLTANATPVNVVFLEPTTAAGTVTLNLTTTGVVYGTDFNTAPAAVSNTITLPFAANVSSVSFVFNRLTTPFEGQVKNVVFTIASISTNGITIPAATKAVQVNFGETPLVTNSVAPAIGGPNVPNQVYVDLSSGASTPVKRTSWDLGFYSGSEFRVVLNGSIKMAVKKLDITDMTQVVTVDNTVAVGEGGGSGVVNGNKDYVDGPSGDITLTAMSEVSSTDSENKVYLVNLGFGLSTVVPNAGSVNAYGDARGWKKIRILKSGSDYKLQYADVAATTFSEVTITKNSAYNFTFFSFDTKAVVAAEPEKAKWDLNFTSFTNHTNMGTGLVSYPFQDFIVTNAKGGTRAYQVLNSAGVAYAAFTLANVTTANFEAPAAADQTVIGSNWRNGGGPTTLPSIKDDRFYVIKDAAGNIYKVRFVAMINAASERGNPSFEYSLLK